MPRRSKVATLPAPTRAEIDEFLGSHGFGSYRELASELAQRGISISRSALQRYGEHLEHRIEAVRAATAQARAIVEEIGPDDESEVADAFRRVAQSDLFECLLKAREVIEQAGRDGDVDLDRLVRSFSELERSRMAAQRRADNLELRLARAAKIVSDAAVIAGNAGGVSVGGSAPPAAPARTLQDLRSVLMGEGDQR